MNRLLLALVAALSLTIATDAHAQAAQRGGNLLSGWLVLDPGSPAGVGLGARFLLPVIPEGLLTGQLRNGVREELDLEVGADFLHWGYDVTYAEPYYPYTIRTDTYGVGAFEIVGGLLWNWWLTPTFAVYPKVDLGYRYAWVTDWPDAIGYHAPGYSEIFLNGAAGLMFKANKFTLRLEAGNHSLKLGAGMAL